MSKVRWRFAPEPWDSHEGVSAMTQLAADTIEGSFLSKEVWLPSLTFSELALHSLDSDAMKL